MNRLGIVFVSLALTISVTVSQAGEDLVAWPDNYAAYFVRYHSIDKPAGDNPAKIRFFYVNPESLAHSAAGQPLADGTVLIMEERKVVLDPAGKPVTDRRGRYVPTDEIIGVLVQQKKTGWGGEYRDDVRNGEWEYAVFNTDGTRKQGVEYEKCFICHKTKAQADYNFTFSSFLSRMKP